MQAGALTSSGASGVVQSEKRSLASAKSPVGARRVRESRAVDGRDESRAHESRVNESRAHGRPRREGGRVAEVSSILGKGAHHGRRRCQGRGRWCVCQDRRA